MCYTPNCREDEFYNFESLDTIDQMLVSGYDYLAEDVIEAFFDNLDIFDFDIEGEDINIGRFFENHPKIFNAFQDALSEFIEAQRNELIVSILDGYENDYEDSENEENLDDEIVEDYSDEENTVIENKESKFDDCETKNVDGDIDG